MRTLTLSREPLVTGCYASRSRWLRFAARHLNDQRPSGSTSWIFREHSDEMTRNILARQWHPRLGTSTDEAIRVLIQIVALQGRDRLKESVEAYQDADARHQGFVELIAPAARNIHAYWLARRAPAPDTIGDTRRPIHKVPVPGRNDRCPLWLR
jgi:hypothetical protein